MKKILALILIFATMATFCLSLVSCIGEEGTETLIAADNTSKQIPADTILTGGMQVGASTDHGIRLLSTELEPTQFANYGISALAETAVTIHATVSPDGVADQGVEWSIAWTNPADTWASGKNISDYVSFSSYGKQATVSCLQAFGEQITVTATSNDNPAIKATCTLEYAQKVTTASLNIGNIPVNFNGTTGIQYEIAPSITGKGGTVTANVTTNDVYTVAENFTKTVTISMGTDTNAWFQLSGYFPTGMAINSASGTNWHGKSLYFDYDHDIKNWFITLRNGDVAFSSMSTATISNYFSNITVPYLATVTLTLQGQYSSYTYTSDLICTGFTNSTPVQAVTLDKNTYVF